MHIPDGYLSPQTYAPMIGVMAPFWAIAARRARETMRGRRIPLLAMGAVFSFVIMMFNIPAPGGSTGHAVGGALLGIIIGPWAAVIAITVALVIQALMFGDGGITAIGANCFNMAVLMPFAGYYTYRWIAGGHPGSKRAGIAAAVAGYVSLNLAALSTAVIFGIQPIIAHAANGAPLYAPYSLKTAIVAMMSEHLLLFGFVEAATTSLVVTYLMKSQPNLLFATEGGDVTDVKRGSLRWLWVGLIGLAAATPIGLLARGTAWGEWSADDLKVKLGNAPVELQRLEGAWKAAMPGYGIPGVHADAATYAIAAVVGGGATALVVWFAARAIFGGKDKEEDTNIFLS